MRYTLRNQEKIKSHFEPYGEETLNRINESLKNAFSSNDIENYIDNWENEPYPILCIDDIGHSFNMIAFYVLKKQYDVYNLAFKEFIG